MPEYNDKTLLFIVNIQGLNTSSRQLMWSFLSME